MSVFFSIRYIIQIICIWFILRTNSISNIWSNLRSNTSSNKCCKRYIIPIICILFILRSNVWSNSISNIWSNLWSIVWFFLCLLLGAHIVDVSHDDGDIVDGLYDGDDGVIDGPYVGLVGVVCVGALVGSPSECWPWLEHGFYLNK